MAGVVLVVVMFIALTVQRVGAAQLTAYQKWSVRKLNSGRGQRVRGNFGVQQKLRGAAFNQQRPARLIGCEIHDSQASLLPYRLVPCVEYGDNMRRVWRHD
eukprot:scaffold85262_cov39-Prasinocladus_malaysianus.AAC.1